LSAFLHLVDGCARRAEHARDLVWRHERDELGDAELGVGCGAGRDGDLGSARFVPAERVVTSGGLAQ
jgi:hypothetical protein